MNENVTMTDEQFKLFITRLGGSLAHPVEQPIDWKAQAQQYISEILATATRSWYGNKSPEYACLQQEVIAFLVSKL